MSALLAFHVAVSGYYATWIWHLLASVVPDILASVPEVRSSVVLLSVQFATVWVMVLHGVYFLCCLGEHAQRATGVSAHAQSSLRRFTDAFFADAVWPATIVVCVDFWTAFSLDPGLLDPFGVLMRQIDPQVNHVLHSNIVPVALAALCARPNPALRRAPFAEHVRTQAVLLGVYFLVVLGVQPFTPIWTYPLFGRLGAALWLPFFAANVALAVCARCFAHALSTALAHLGWRGLAGDEQTARHKGDCAVMGREVSMVQGLGDMDSQIPVVRS